ncbi:hypothetical protein NIES4106_29430 [Fischerella sp. NIES-4106]|nr:hypothetical protein NIES4106_29430 [Fischerella sp. NIES-4106]
MCIVINVKWYEMNDWAVTHMAWEKDLRICCTIPQSPIPVLCEKPLARLRVASPLGESPIPKKNPSKSCKSQILEGSNVAAKSELVIG